MVVPVRHEAPPNPFVWYFDSLPIHPRPYPGESMTSWILRLAVANGIRTLAAMATLFRPDIHVNTQYMMVPDAQWRAFDAIARIAACPTAAVIPTTFYYLAQKFWRQTSLASGRLLHGSIAPSLRYCPSCLATYPRYLLIWRFLALPGCVEHDCRLLDMCPHCRQPVPLLAPPFAVGVCGSCGGRLAAGRAPTLTDEERHQAVRRARDLAYLLAPHPDSFDGRTVAAAVGEQLVERRLSRGLTRSDIAGRLGVPLSVVRSMDHVRGEGDGVARRVGGKLAHYFRYADEVDIALCDLFRAAPAGEKCDQASRRERRETALTALVEQSIADVRDDYGFVTQKAVCDRVGLSAKALKNYQRVAAALDRGVAGSDDRVERRRLQREAEVLRRVQVALQRLKAGRMVVTRKAVAEMIGMGSTNLREYPAALHLVHAAVAECKANSAGEHSSAWMSA